jgi:hypothetical protein
VPTPEVGEHQENGHEHIHQMSTYPCYATLERGLIATANTYFFSWDGDAWVCLRNGQNGGGFGYSQFQDGPSTNDAH